MLANENACVGCRACEQACIQKAIRMFDNDEGFIYPKIDESLCTRCGRCSESCPILTMPQTFSSMDAYAFQLKDDEALRNSTSGGAFHALAEEFTKRGGVVFGCVWDDHYNAVLKSAVTSNELKAMQGSKYVFSDTGNTYTQVNALLLQKKPVLYFGLPCQIAGLRAYLKRDDDNLTLVDLLCAGAPSPKALRAYVKMIAEGGSCDQLCLKFRDKYPNGWGVHVTYRNNGKTVHRQEFDSSYFFSYMRKYSLRLSCYKCKFRFVDRVSDLTIADYWGIQNFHPEFGTFKGASAIIINTDKGQELFDSVKDRGICVKTDIGNICLRNSISQVKKEYDVPIPPKRDKLFAVLKEGDWSKVEKRVLGSDFRRFIYRCLNSVRVRLRRVGF